MKTETLFASIFLSLLTYLSVALAAPVPAKGVRVKGYPLRSESPPPGESGVHYDEAKKRINVNYGDKDMVKHMEHTMYNQRKHPENDRAFKPGKAGDTSNRNKALSHLDNGLSKESNKKWNKSLTKHKAYDLQRSNDEKPHNSMKHDGKGVTVRPLPRIESDRERNLMSTATGKARKTPGTNIHFKANPGPNYQGRGDRSLSRATVRNPSREKPAWNAGPGKRSHSSGPYPKGKHPDPQTAPVRRGRSTTPKPIGGKSPSSSRSSSSSSSGPKPGPSGDKKAKSPSPKGGRSPSPKERTPSPKPKTPSPEPSKGKGKQKAAAETPKKPAWNAGPGAQRKSQRVAAQPKPKASTSAPTTKTTGKRK